MIRLTGISFTFAILLIVPSLAYSCQRCEPLADAVGCQHGFESGGELCVSDIDSCFTIGTCEGSSQEPQSTSLAPDWPIVPDGSNLLVLYPGKEAQCQISPCGKEDVLYVGFYEPQLETIRENSDLLAQVLGYLRSSEARGLPIASVPSGLFMSEERTPIHFSGQIAVGAEFEMKAYFEFTGHPEISSIFAVWSSSTPGRRLVGSIEKVLVDGEKVTRDF